MKTIKLNKSCLALKGKPTSTKLISADIVGSPTISNFVVSGFNTTSYLKTPTSMNVSSGQTWEVVIKFKAPSSSSANQVLFEVTNGGLNRAISIYRSHANGKLAYCLSGSTSSNNIANDVIGTNTCALNTTYWVKLKFTGSVYQAYISTNGVDWTLDFSKASTVPIYAGTSTTLGAFLHATNLYWQGSVDLSGCYIDINGNRWWSGVKDLVGTTYKVCR